MERKSYYFITVFCRYDEHGPHGMRCWGFYDNFAEANVNLRLNVTDLWETCYNYAVIEEYQDGISGYQFERWFYSYSRDIEQYIPMEEPKELKHYAGFALG